MSIDVKVALATESVADLDERLAFRRELEGPLDDVGLTHVQAEILVSRSRLGG